MNLLLIIFLYYISCGPFWHRIFRIPKPVNWNIGKTNMLKVGAEKRSVERETREVIDGKIVKENAEPIPRYNKKKIAGITAKAVLGAGAIVGTSYVIAALIDDDFSFTPQYSTDLDFPDTGVTYYYYIPDNSTAYNFTIHKVGFYK